MRKLFWAEPLNFFSVVAVEEVVVVVVALKLPRRRRSNSKGRMEGWVRL